MSPDPGRIMARWFVAASVLSVLLTLAIAFVVTRPLLERQRAVIAPPNGGSSQNAPAGGEVKPAPPVVTPLPRQLDDNGTVLAWGASTLDRTVTLELRPFDRERMAAALFEVSRDDAPARSSRSPEFTVRLADLEPGRYRWSARIELRPGGVSPEIAPPRGDVAAADFIILPPPPAIQRLSQSGSDGKPLAADRRAEGAVRLVVELMEEFPAGVLEFEVSPVGRPGNPQLLQVRLLGRAADVRFSGADGRYRWRARLVPPSPLPPGPWSSAAAGPEFDFVLFSKPPEKPADKPPIDPSKPQTSPRDPRTPPGAQQGPPTRPSGATTSASTGSGGLGQGSRAPLPSEQVTQTSFWQVAFMRLLMGLGALAVALGVLVLALRGLRRLLVRS